MASKDLRAAFLAELDRHPHGPETWVCLSAISRALREAGYGVTSLHRLVMSLDEAGTVETWRDRQETSERVFVRRRAAKARFVPNPQAVGRHTPAA